ncbi:DUF305 domain-containing protein [Arthrobacter sp. Y81]|uniref:DUF305 domain-containing protein n=1 Tax=Arthrobacter sp. Y81 TaxID=2058897 RepID=UPI000CE3032A|nr:DUF305 domain-containing protein [Arthrobacter sp. Y81]
MKKNLTLSAAALAAVIALAGCATDSTTTAGNPSTGSGSSMDHGAMGSSSAPADSAAAMGHNAADTMFAQSMIPHHAQAVEMSELMLKKQGADPDVTELATRIKAAQAPEIEQMTGWLNGWNESTQVADGHSMSGMMGADDLQALGAAQGKEADKLFLTQMIAHHKGAVDMAKAEIADGGNSDAIKLSEKIIAAQEAEIKEMENLLAAAQ